MSLTGPDFWSPEQGTVMVTAIGHVCFYCERPTTDPAIVWSGADAVIFLHPTCLPNFDARLTRDLWVWQRRTGHRFGATA